MRNFDAEVAAAQVELQNETVKRITASGDALGPAAHAIRDTALAQLDAFRDTSVETFMRKGNTAALVIGGRQVWRIVGHYRGLLNRLGTIPFKVTPLEEHGAIVDVTIQTLDAPISPDALALKSDIDTASNVIQAVMTERLRRLTRFAGHEDRAKITTLRTEYLKQLTGLAMVGLETTEPSRVTFARQDLERLKALFTLREAGVVKNDYVWRLLRWTVLAVSVCVGLYVLASAPGCTRLLNAPTCRRMFDLRNFDLLAAGTAIGTWLSFSLRTPALSFVNLAVLEPDRLNPLARVIFMIGLSGTLGLLLFTGAVKAGLGNVEGLDALHIHGSWALLLGLLSGIAERALGTAVSQTGAKFIGIVGGEKKAAAS